MKLWLCIQEHLYCGKHFKNKEVVLTEDYEFPESYNGGFSYSWRELYASDFPGLVGYAPPPPDMSDIWNELQALRNRVLKLEQEGGTVGEISKQKIRQAAWFE